MSDIFVDDPQVLMVNGGEVRPKAAKEALWHWDFDTNGNAKKGPRAEDRRVAVWFEPRAAWKAMQAAN